MLISKNNYFQDEQGQWYYLIKSGYTTKANIYTCCVCNNTFPRMPSHITNDQCICCTPKCANIANSRERIGKYRGLKSHLWTGGISRKYGYVFILSPHHPFRNKSNYVAEHRLVMEQHIGRFLTKTETVHHKNGIRDDNRIENLELWSKQHASGSRVEDLIDWAIKLLEEYRPYLLNLQKIEELHKDK